PVARAPSVVHFRLVLEDDVLLAALVSEHVGANLRPADQGAADLHAIVVPDHQDAIDVDSLSRLGLEALHRERIPRRDLVLLPAGFDDGEHANSQTGLRRIGAPPDSAEPRHYTP